jgi:hypothetical protein
MESFKTCVEIGVGLWTIHVLQNHNVVPGRWKVHDYFSLLLCKSSIWFTEKHIIKIIIYFSNTSKCPANYVISFELFDGFKGQKKFEDLMARKSVIRPWLSCLYNKNTILDLPSSVFGIKQLFHYCPRHTNLYQPLLMTNSTTHFLF